MNKYSDISTLKRPIREKKQQALFDLEPDWREHWWGMPEFTMGDISPQKKITVNFACYDDVVKFAELIGAKVTGNTDSLWFPYRGISRTDLVYDGEPTDSRYPICIPSKGRWDCARVNKLLDRMGVSYRFFVEETEGDKYINVLGENKVVVMPFHDLGQGSIPARNFIWEWAKEHGHKRHWTVDDNIIAFGRITNNREWRVRGGGFFMAMEDFVDRHENIAMAGPHACAFIDKANENLTPFMLNNRVYSCILLDTSLPHRWRGRYNEDTDLSLRLLKDGYCTLLFRALFMKKPDTAGGMHESRRNVVKGGNTDNVYNTGDHRLAFAQSLADQHPDVVKVVWKFNRWHHQVDYSPFKKNKLILKPGITPIKANNEYGMRLVRVNDAVSKAQTLPE